MEYSLAEKYLQITSITTEFGSFSFSLNRYGRQDFSIYNIVKTAVTVR